MFTLAKYEPTAQLQRVQSDFDRFFTDSLWRMGANPLRLDGGLFHHPIDTYMTVGDNLSVDMYETSDEVIVKADLPEVDPEDIEVEERDGWLTIRAKSQRESEQTQHNWYVRERRYGLWQRTVRLPVAVYGDRADANFVDGILTVKLPKVDSDKPLFNRIPIKWPKLRLPKLSKKEKKVKVNRG